jgi:hypothetical protein
VGPVSMTRDGGIGCVSRVSAARGFFQGRGLGRGDSLDRFGGLRGRFAGGLPSGIRLCWG